MTALWIVIIVQAVIIISLLAGWRELARLHKLKCEQMRIDWWADLIDLGIAWRCRVKVIGGDWNLDVTRRCRYFEKQGKS